MIKTLALPVPLIPRLALARTMPDMAGLAGLTAAVLLLFVPLLTHMLWGRGFDYPLHLEFVKAYREGTGALVSYPLFHLAVLGVYPLLPEQLHLETYKQAGLIVGVGLYLFTAVVLYAAYARPGVGGGPGYRRAGAAVVVTLLLLLVAPVNLFSISEGHLYWGYFLPNIHMNPTLTALKPLALLSFVYVVGAFSDRWHFKTGVAVALAAALTVLATLAKPNYTLVMLPVVTLFGTYRWWRGGIVHWRLLIIGLVGPAVGLLGLQYVVLHNSPFSGGAMLFQPFGVEAAHGVQQVGLKLLLSILFPLVVFITYWARARRSTALHLAWLLFGAGALVSYCFVEENRVADGNFVWSGHIAVTILFAASMQFFLREQRRTGGFTRTALLCVVALALHGLGGAFWYYADSVSPGFVWY